MGAKGEDVVVLRKIFVVEGSEWDVQHSTRHVGVSHWFLLNSSPYTIYEYEDIHLLFQDPLFSVNRRRCVGES